MARPRPRAARPPSPDPATDQNIEADFYLNPFTILVDTNELQHQTHYTFSGLTTNAALGGRPIRVPLAFRHLGKGRGDYQIEGMPGVCVERKTLADLFGSVRSRANFVERLEVMAAGFRLAVVMVEAERSEILRGPPPFSRFPPKSVNRSIFAWMVRYPTVHWEFWPGRAAAEAATFRILEAFWTHHQPEA